jgi:hypothetical protein
MAGSRAFHLALSPIVYSDTCSSLHHLETEGELMDGMITECIYRDDRKGRTAANKAYWASLELRHSRPGFFLEYNQDGGIGICPVPCSRLVDRI